MKYRLLFLALIILLAIAAAGLAQITYGPLTIGADISGSAVWNDGAVLKISPGSPFSINIYESYAKGPTDSNRATWFGPFTFTQSGLASVTWADYSIWPDPSFYNSTNWDLSRGLYVESWGDGLPDLFSIWGVANLGGLPGGTLNVFHAYATVTLVNNNIPGQICIEKGIPQDSSYDWMFEDPVPTFDKVCWPVSLSPCKGCQAPIITNCPSQLSTQHDVPFTYSFNATDFEGNPISWTANLGNIDAQGNWTFDPPCIMVGQTVTLTVCAGNTYYPCPNGAICTVNLIVENTPPVISGDCGKELMVCGPFQAHFRATDANLYDTQSWSCSTYGDIEGQIGIFYPGDFTFTPTLADLGIHELTIRVTDCAGAYDECNMVLAVIDNDGCKGGDVNGNGVINPLDITYLINFLYKLGPAPLPDSVCSGDSNGDCSTNMLDITFLINYLYKHGGPPLCRFCF